MIENRVLKNKKFLKTVNLFIIYVYMMVFVLYQVLKYTLEPVYNYTLLIIITFAIKTKGKMA